MCSKILVLLESISGVVGVENIQIMKLDKNTFENWTFTTTMFKNTLFKNMFRKKYNTIMLKNDEFQIQMKKSLTLNLDWVISSGTLYSLEKSVFKETGL